MDWGEKPIASETSKASRKLGLIYSKIPPIRQTSITTSLIDILAQGYVKSYQELFRLTHTQNNNTSELGTYSEQNVNVLFPDDDVKEVVTSLKLLLIGIEDAERANQVELQIEAHTKIGKFYTDLLKYDFAEQHYRAALTLSTEKDVLYIEAAKNLSRVLTLLGRQLEALNVLEVARQKPASTEKKIPDVMISILLQMSDEQSAAANYLAASHHLAKAWHLASTSNLSESTTAVIMYRRGITALALRIPDQATKLLEEYKSIVVKMQDVIGEAKAYSSLAKISEQNGDLSSAARYLESYLNLAQTKPELAFETSKACRKLGLIYSKMGKHEESARFFESSLERPNSKNSIKALSEDADAHVQLGIARGNALMPRLFELVKDNDVSALLKWKKSRELPDLAVAPAANV